MDTTYSMNFAMLSIIAEDKDPTVSDLRRGLIIAYRT
jgi:hypothetical protein